MPAIATAAASPEPRRTHAAPSAWRRRTSEGVGLAEILATHGVRVSACMVVHPLPRSAR